MRGPPPTRVRRLPARGRPGSDRRLGMGRDGEESGKSQQLSPNTGPESQSRLRQSGDLEIRWRRRSGPS